MKKQTKTAADLVPELERDPEYVARVRQQDEVRKRRAQEYRDAAAPLLAELATAGFDVASVSALRHQGSGWRRAIPILLGWLPRVGNPDVKEDIVRALSVPSAKPAAASALVAEFRRADPGHEPLRWAIGNALEVVADDSVLDDLIEIVRDQRNGKSREMFAAAFGKHA